MRAFTLRELSTSMSFVFAACLGMLLISAIAPDIAAAHPAKYDALEVSKGDARHVRRCKLGSKQEICYWVKVGSQPASQR